MEMTAGLRLNGYIGKRPLRHGNTEGNFRNIAIERTFDMLSLPAVFFQLEKARGVNVRLGNADAPSPA
jgi:hypothetical protein